MDSDDGGTVGIWIPNDSDLVEGFDSTVAARVGPASYSRSEQIREAMELYMAVLETMDDVGWPDLGPRDRQAAIRQAIIDQERREDA